MQCDLPLDTAPEATCLGRLHCQSCEHHLIWIPTLPQSLLSEAVTTPSGIRWLVAELPGVEGKALQEAAVQLQASLGDPSAVILAAELDGNASFVAAFSPAVGGKGCHTVKTMQYRSGIIQ